MSEYENLAYAIHTIKRYEEYRMKKYWGIMIIITGILRTLGNLTFIEVAAFYISGILKMDYFDAWHPLITEYFEVISFYISLMQIIPFFMAFYIFVSVKRLQTDGIEIRSSRYVHFGLILVLIPGFASLGTFFYFFLTRIIYDFNLLNTFYFFLDIINAWPLITPLLNPVSDFYLIDSAVLLILSYYLLPSDVKTKNFKKLRKAGPIMCMISVPLLVVETVVFWEAIDDPIIHINNPVLWVIYHHFLLLMLLIFLLSTFICGIYAIKTAYQVLGEKETID